MQLDQNWLLQQGDDAMLLHVVASCHLPRQRLEHIGIAVSGGGDSMALLHLAYRVTQQTGQKLTAMTVDHGLRPESAAEAAGVAAFCKKLDIPQVTLKWTGWEETGNLQSAARDARYQLMADYAKTQNIDAIMLGHTVDDGAENFLMRLARSAGPDGLGTMNTRFARNGITWLRPLWQASREELREYLRRHAVGWVDDPSNDDSKYERVKARKILKALKPLGITADTLHQTSFAITQSNWLVKDHIRAKAAQYVQSANGDVLITSSRRSEISPELQRRFLIAAIKWISSSGYGPRESGLTELDVALMTSGKGTLCGCIFTQDDSGTRITRELNAVKDIVAKTDQTWDRRWQFEGPHAPDLAVRALGEGIRDCPDWRDTGLPRTSLMSSPSIWRGDTLIAAPIAGYSQGWTARIVADFHSSLLSH